MDKRKNRLIKGYLAKADEKIEVAAGLMDEGAYDDVVSRAYYAAFHVTKKKRARL